MGKEEHVFNSAENLASVAAPISTSKQDDQPDAAATATAAAAADNGNGNNNNVGIVHLGFVEPIEDSEQLMQVAFRSPNYNVWDGGQLGGCPNWLHPKHIPQGPLLCPKGHIMMHLCQIYAPVDEMEDRAFHRALYVFACAQCCSSCGGDGSGANDSNSNTPKNDNNKPQVRVLRVQLPKENAYFPGNPKILSKEELESWQKHLPKVNLCQVCGFKASYQCPLQKQYFCCKEHQKEYFRCIFHPLEREQGEGQPSPQTIELPSLYPIAEIVVEAENDNAESSGSGDKDEAAKLQTISTMFPVSEDGEDDSDEDLEQDDMNRMARGGNSNKKTSGVTDSTTLSFLEQCRHNPDQVLRYNRWPSASSSTLPLTPLWFRQEGQPPNACTFPPPCDCCGAPRKFEFQLMPQMLHYLLKRRREQNQRAEKSNTPAMEQHWKKVMDAMQQADTWIEQVPPEQVPPGLVEAREAATRNYQQAKLGNASSSSGKSQQQELDFGVIAVYTCTASCGGGTKSNNAEADDSGDVNPYNASLGAYREEFAWVQTSS